MPSLHIIFASTSGHTEHVVDVLRQALQTDRPEILVEQQRVEQAEPEDLVRGDIVILASGTWNTGSVEGQLNPHMHAFLRERAATIDLHGKHVAVIGLGDERYRYTARAADHLETFVRTHGGVLLEPVLRIVNEPYGQEESVKKWGAALFSALS